MSSAEFVKKNIERWRNEDYTALWAKIGRGSRTTDRQLSGPVLRGRREERHAGKGECARAVGALEAAECSPTTEETRKIAESKHPKSLHTLKGLDFTSLPGAKDV